MKRFRLNALAWQTVAKTIEHEVNSIPLGYLLHQGDEAKLLRVLTPNFLKLNVASNRAPSGLFSIPDKPQGLTSGMETAYKTFYKVWNEDYIPLIANR